MLSPRRFATLKQRSGMCEVVCTGLTRFDTGHESLTHTLPAFGSRDNLEAKSGDVLFAALLMVGLLERDYGISLANAMRHVTDKIIRRCPHVFPDDTAV